MRIPVNLFSTVSSCFAFFQTVKSEFLPKVVGTCFAVFMVLLFLGHSEKLVTLDTLEKLGYFDTLVSSIILGHPFRMPWSV
jgi:hypothetical protein